MKHSKHKGSKYEHKRIKNHANLTTKIHAVQVFINHNHKYHWIHFLNKKSPHCLVDKIVQFILESQKSWTATINPTITNFKISQITSWNCKCTQKMYISQNPLTETGFMQQNKAIDGYLVENQQKCPKIAE